MKIYQKSQVTNRTLFYMPFLTSNFPIFNTTQHYEALWWHKEFLDLPRFSVPSRIHRPTGHLGDGAFFSDRQRACSFSSRNVHAISDSSSPRRTHLFPKGRHRTGFPVCAE